jgi:hypothetical protein
MDYEIVTVDGNKYVTVFVSETSAQTFPADESNLDFVAFIEMNPDAIKKVRAS